MSERYRRADDGSLGILPSSGSASDGGPRRGWYGEEKDVGMKWTPWKKAVAVLLLATAVGIAEATQVYVGSAAQSKGLSFARSLAATVPSWFVLALLLPPTFWLARRFRLDMHGWRYSQALPIHLAASVMFTAVHLGMSIWLSDHVLIPGPAPQPFFVNLTRLLTVYFVLDTLFYWSLVAGYYAFDYSRRYHDIERVNAQLALKESRLETSLSRASLEALRMQLNPHFLFNTLNTISVLAMKGERQRVVRMINRLSDLLRLSLENSRQTITLGEEVDFMQRYLEIEQVRFRDRLHVRVDVPEDLLDAEVPSLLLQPLVENAVIHGIGQQLDGGEVEIVGRRVQDRLILTVSDTGPGFADHQLRNGAGVGLGNTAARLEQLYGDDHELGRANRAEGGAVVLIEIPYRVLQRELPEEVEWRKSAP